MCFKKGLFTQIQTQWKTGWLLSAKKMEQEANRQQQQFMSPLKNVKRGQLFSPAKQQLFSPAKLFSPVKQLTQQSIQDLLCSPDKTVNEKNNQLSQLSVQERLFSPAKVAARYSARQSAAADLFGSPTKVAAVRPGREESRLSILVSPRKVGHYPL